jgi:hypothetical protein
MSNKATAAVLASMVGLLSQFPINKTPTVNIKLIHKDKKKRQKLAKTLKSGRNHPAKGYDPVTKKWVKP